MANGPTLPPQAYTREILTAAFNWLQAQPESVKKLAVTPDALVGLYMRAQRYGASSMEVDAPVSSQNFMSDLRHLAEGLKQFEEPRRPSTPPLQHHARGESAPMHIMAMPSAPTHPGVASSHGHGVAPTAASTPQQTHSVHQHLSQSASQQGMHHGASTAPHSYANAHPNGSPFAPPLNAAATALSNDQQLTFALNEKAQQMIQEVKLRLNLSSHAEAINMMVSLGYKQIHAILN